MYAGFLRRYFGRSSATGTASDDLDDLVWICVQILECIHPPNASFEEMMATAARVRSQRSEAGRFNPPISLPPFTPSLVRHKLRELALALNPLASDEDVVPRGPTEPPAPEQFPPTGQAPAAEDNLEAQGALLPNILENSDEGSGRFPHVP